MKLLIVDDEPDLLVVLTSLLESAGFDVVGVREPYQALTLLEDRGIDILIADVVLPGMSGLELAHQAIGKNKNLKVILTSGLVPLDVELPGGMRFLQKPFEMADLFAAIRKV